MKNIRALHPVKKMVALVMAVGMMISGALTVIARDYDLRDGDITVTAIDGGQNVLQNETNTPDTGTVTISSYYDDTSHTVTVGPGTEVTLKNVMIEDTGGKPGVTVTGTGEAATVTMQGVNIYNNNESGTPGVLVEENAELNLQVSNYNYIYGCTDYRGGSGAPAIQLDDGATITVSDKGNSGDLILEGSNLIGTANGSDADVTINITENNELSVNGEFDAGNGSYGIGTGEDMGTAYITVNGSPYIYGYDRYSSSYIPLQSFGDYDVEGIYYFTQSSAYDDFYTARTAKYRELSGGGMDYSTAQTEACKYALDLFISEGTVIRLDGIQKPAEETAEEPAEELSEETAEELSEEPAAPAAPAAAAASEEYITAGGFAASFISAVGKYNAEVEALKGSAYEETFGNFKSYVEKNKLFDTAGLEANTALTAGQIAVVLCKAADVSVSGEEDALAKLQEKGILRNRKVNSPVPVTVAQIAVKQFVREFLANK